MASPTAASTDRFEEHDGDITYIRTDKDLPPVAHHRSIADHHPPQDHLRDHRAARCDRVGGHRVLPRGDGQRGVVRHRGDLHLRDRFPVLCPADRAEDRPPARRHATPAELVRKRHRLHADRPAGAVRTSLRRDRGRGSAGRPGACHADGLSAGHHLDHHRRGIRRMCAGLPRAVDLHPTTGPLAGSDGPRRTRRRRRRGRHHRRSSRS